MAKIFANTLDEPERDVVESMVLAAIDPLPESRAWSVFILQIRGLNDVYVSIECADRVVRSWLFAGSQDPIRERIRGDLALVRPASQPLPST